MPDCPPVEDSDDVSVTNSEVETAMNHRRRRAILQDLGFLEESFNAFNLVDAYIRAARDVINRATKQHLKDVQVNLFCLTMITSSPRDLKELNQPIYREEHPASS